MQGGQVKPGGCILHGINAPDQRRVIGGDKAQGGKTCLFHRLGQQKAKRLLCVAPGKAIDHQMFATVMRKAFAQQGFGIRQPRQLALQGQPLGGVGRKLGPALLLEYVKNPLGQNGRCGEFCSIKHSDLWIATGLIGHFDGHLTQALVPHDLTADQKGVARRQGGGKGFLHLAQGGAAKAVFQPHLQGFHVNDGAKVLTDHGRCARVAQVPLAAGLLQALPAIISAQRIAAGRHEIERGVKFPPRQRRIRACGDDLCIKLLCIERPRAGRQQDMLAQHIAGAGAARFAIQSPLAHGVQRGLAFDHFKAIGGQQQGF